MAGVLLKDVGREREIGRQSAERGFLVGDFEEGFFDLFTGVFVGVAVADLISAGVVVHYFAAGAAGVFGVGYFAEAAARVEGEASACVEDFFFDVIGERFLLVVIENRHDGEGERVVFMRL
jgi:hypothetical protein